MAVTDAIMWGPAGSYGRQLLEDGGEGLKLQPWQIALGIAFTVGALGYIGRIAKDVRPPPLHPPDLSPRMLRNSMVCPWVACQDASQRARNAPAVLPVCAAFSCTAVSWYVHGIALEEHS